MKNKGFTLVELLGTIVILSLIVIVAFPAVISQMKKSNEEVDSSVKILVETAARDYANDNMETFKKPNSGIITFETKSVRDLTDAGYLKNSVYDKNCEIQNDSVIIKADKNKYIIEYKAVGDTAC